MRPPWLREISLLPTGLRLLLFSVLVTPSNAAFGHPPPTSPNNPLHVLALANSKAQTPEDPVCCLIPLPPIPDEAATPDSSKEPPKEKVEDEPQLMSFEEWKEKRFALQEIARQRREARERTGAGENGQQQPVAEVPNEQLYPEAPSAEKDKEDPTTPSVPGSEEQHQPQQPISPHFKVPTKDRFNYASTDCSARVHTSHKSAKSPSAILSEKRDRYMLSPCDKSKEAQYVVVELCDDIHIDTVQLANFEFFSGVFKDIKISVSKTYLEDLSDWTYAGDYRGKNGRGVQTFHPPSTLNDFYRFIRIDFVSHYSSEFYCPISLLRVYGLTHLEHWKWEKWEEEFFEREERTRLERIASSPEAAISPEPEDTPEPASPAVVATADGSTTTAKSTETVGGDVPVSATPNKVVPSKEEETKNSSSGQVVEEKLAPPIETQVTVPGIPHSATAQPTGSATSEKDISVSDETRPETVNAIKEGASDTEQLPASSHEEKPTPRFIDPGMQRDESRTSADSPRSSETISESSIFSATSAKDNSTASEHPAKQEQMSSTMISEPETNSSTAQSSSHSAQEIGEEPIMHESTNMPSSSSGPVTPSSAPATSSLQSEGIAEASSTVQSSSASSNNDPRHSANFTETQTGTETATVRSTTVTTTITPSSTPSSGGTNSHLGYYQGLGGSQGESIYRTIMNKLGSLERNQSLVARYVEEQTGGIREVLRKFGEEVGRLDGVAKAQAAMYSRTNSEFERHRRRMEREYSELMDKVDYLSDEIVLEKRLGIAQLCLLLAVLVFMALTRGSRSESSLAPAMLMNFDGSMSARLNKSMRDFRTFSGEWVRKRFRSGARRPGRMLEGEKDGRDREGDRVTPGKRPKSARVISTVDVIGRQDDNEPVRFAFPAAATGIDARTPARNGNMISRSGPNGSSTRPKSRTRGERSRTPSLRKQPRPATPTRLVTTLPFTMTNTQPRTGPNYHTPSVTRTSGAPQSSTLPRPALVRSSSSNIDGSPAAPGSVAWTGSGNIPRSARRWARSAHLHEVGSRSPLVNVRKAAVVVDLNDEDARGSRAAVPRALGLGLAPLNFDDDDDDEDEEGGRKVEIMDVDVFTQTSPLAHRRSKANLHKIASGGVDKGKTRMEFPIGEYFVSPLVASTARQSDSGMPVSPRTDGGDSDLWVDTDASISVNGDDDEDDEEGSVLGGSPSLLRRQHVGFVGVEA